MVKNFTYVIIIKMFVQLCLITDKILFKLVDQRHKISQAGSIW